MRPGKSLLPPQLRVDECVTESESCCSKDIGDRSIHLECSRLFILLRLLLVSVTREYGEMREPGASTSNGKDNL